MSGFRSRSTSRRRVVSTSRAPSRDAAATVRTPRASSGWILERCFDSSPRRRDEKRPISATLPIMRTESGFATEQDAYRAAMARYAYDDKSRALMTYPDRIEITMVDGSVLVFSWH